MKFTYVPIETPAPARESSASRRSASAHEATTRSMPITATWTGGAPAVSRPLPSLVTVISVPVSAIARFTPVIPRSASRKRRRSVRRANAVIASGSSPPS